MYHRKGPWFAVQKLEYREIPDIKTALDILSENGYVGKPMIKILMNVSKSLTDFHDMEQDGISSMAALLSVEQLREALILAKKQQGNRRMSSMSRQYPCSYMHKSMQSLVRFDSGERIVTSCMCQRQATHSIRNC